MAEYFRLTDKRAIEIVNEVKTSVRNWRKIATKFGLSRAEQELKALAFKKAEN